MLEIVRIRNHTGDEIMFLSQDVVSVVTTALGSQATVVLRNGMQFKVEGVERVRSVIDAWERLASGLPAPVVD